MGVEDGFTIVAVLFIFAMLSIVSYVGISQALDIWTPMYAVATGNNSSANNFKISMLGGFNMLDVGMGLLVALLLIASAAVAYISRSHPFLAIIAFVFQTVIIIFANAMSGAFKDFIGTTSIAPYISAFPLTQAVMGNLGFIVMIITLIIIGLTYIKPRNSMFGDYG